MRELPAGWAWATLGEVAEITPRDAQLTADAPFVTMSAVEIDERYPTRYEQRGCRSGARAQDNDILFARITPCLENGKLAQIPAGHGRVGGSTEFIVVRPGDSLDPGFLFYWCKCPHVRSYAESRMSGATGRMRLAGSDLAACTIAVPPRLEQKRIVTLLEGHLSRLQVASGEAGSAAARLRHFLASTSRSIMCAESVASADPTAEDVLSSVLLRRSNTAVRRKDEAIPPAYFLDLPAGWATASIDQLSSSIQYGTSIKTHSEINADDIAVLRMGNIRDGVVITGSLKYLNKSESSIAGLELEYGDILFNRTNSSELVGKAAVFRGDPPIATFASYLIRCRLVPGVDPEWVAAMINGPIGRSYVNAVMTQQVGQANVNGTKMSAMPIALPPPSLQGVLADRLQSARVYSDRLRDAIEALNEQGWRLRQSILRAAFSGQLANQDSADEPADVLLARIRAEREAAGPTPRKPRARKATTT